MITANGGYRAYSRFRNSVFRFTRCYRVFHDYVCNSRSSQIEYLDLLYRFAQIEEEYLLLKQFMDSLDCPDSVANTNLHKSLVARWREYLSEIE